MPIKFSGYKPEYKRCGCELGEDTVEVMKSIGYTDAQISEIRSKGVFGPA
jgi:crotonobetainyl-CoA:carnitine CoA-transferase CaiB-like acyl-CoA transferase